MVLPDAKIDWTDASNGAVLTAALFMGAEAGIGLYTGRSHVGEAYGPAGAFVILLTWVYYSAIIVLIGADFTWALADTRGKPIRPDMWPILRTWRRTSLKIEVCWTY
ncbi:YhjD/YihY/BrkB family envelope integrity protein [Rhodanobacter sp. C05]|uniref:YihY/virulence factor BrkB family protein n=1 Tax=Rhodanobacter sp. C05 TaxID=1945855 RepID=UPI00098704F8|nr:YhjD/YihY/BrkB family envelope integrity protein [Rhodanobacter sp. C05]OOG41376.1 hypothetical protein B0E51_06635 [Rhodanobacter sp. C05]